MSNKIELSESTVGRVRWAIFTYFFLSGLCFSSWASRIPDIKNILALDDALWGTMLFMIPVGQISGMTFSGWLISKISSRRVVLGSMIGYAITLACIGMISSKVWGVVSLIIFGFFANFCNIAVNTQGVAIETFCKKPIMATFHGGWSLAGLLGALIGLSMTITGISTQIHTIAIAILIIFGTIVNYKYLQRDAPVAISVAGNEGKSKIEPFLILLGIVGFFGMAAEGAMTDWNGVYLRDVVGVADYLAPLGLSAYMITMASGRFMVDNATAKWGRRRILQICGSAIFVGMMMTVLFPSLITTIIAFMIIGFGTCGLVPTLYSVAGSKTKMQTGRALTILSSISFMGFLLGPPIIGYISNATNLRYSYALIGVLGLCIIFMSSRLRVLKDERKA